MDEGVLLASKYAFSPNHLKYCGTESFCKTLETFNPDLLASELSNFPVHYGYLDLIAKSNSLNPFDLDVVRAFWTGNSLLENVSAQDIKTFLSVLLKDNPQKAHFLSNNLPPGILVHHNFNALYVNFVTQKVPKTMENFDNCSVTSGRVLAVDKNCATVKRNRLALSKNGDYVIEESKETIDLVRDGFSFVDPSSLSEGDFISIHWKMAVEILDHSTLKNLEKYTKKNLVALNNAYWGKID